MGNLLLTQCYDDIDARRVVREILAGDLVLRNLGVSATHVVDAGTGPAEPGTGSVLWLEWHIWGRSAEVIAQTLLVTVAPAGSPLRSQSRVMELLLRRAEFVLESPDVTDLVPLLRVQGRGRRGDRTASRGPRTDTARYEVLSRRHSGPIATAAHRSIGTVQGWVQSW